MPDEVGVHRERAQGVLQLVVAGVAGGVGLLVQDLGDAALLVAGPRGPHPRIVAVHPGVDDVDGERHVVQGGQGQRGEGRQLPLADPHGGRLLLGRREDVRDTVGARRDEGFGEDVLGPLRLHPGQPAGPVGRGEELRPVLPEFHVAGEFRTAQGLAGGPEVDLPDPQDGRGAQRGGQRPVHEQRGMLQQPAGQRSADEHRPSRVQRLQRGEETVPVDGVHTDGVTDARGRHQEVRDALPLECGDHQTEVGRGRLRRAEPGHDPPVERLAADRHRAERRVRGRGSATAPQGAQPPQSLGRLPLGPPPHPPDEGTHGHVAEPLFMDARNTPALARHAPATEGCRRVAGEFTNWAC